MAQHLSYSITVYVLPGAHDVSISGEQANAVYAALNSRNDLKWWDEEEQAWKVIPFHAVDHAVVEILVEDKADPEDDTCNEMDKSDDGGDDSGGGGGPK